MNRYQLRPSVDEDFEFYRIVHEAALREYVEQIWGWDDAQQLALLKERFVPSKTQIIILGQKDVGILQVEERQTEVFLGNILLMPEFQNLGLGSMIINDIAHRAAPLPVTLSVLKPNPAKRLYERLGFVVIKEEDSRFHMMRRVNH